MGQQETVVREFTKQAAAFGDPLLNTPFTRHLARLVAFAEPELDQEDIVLEVACGTGLVSRAVAGRVRHVTALDITPAMLRQGKSEADHAGITNVTFARGDATDLPYVDRSFTLLLNRLSLHQVADPAAVVREMVRVSRPGAGIIIADIVRPADLAGDPDRLERLRDPSHAAILTAEQVAALVAEAGAEVKRTEVFEEVRPVETWMEIARTPPDAAKQIRIELEAELAGGPVTGMRPVAVDGEIHFTRTHLHLAATAP